MKPERTGYSIPIDSKTVWVQLGISAFRKEVVGTFPITKQSDLKRHSIYEIDLNQFPCEVLNFIVECISPEVLRAIPDDLQPPTYAEVITIDEWEPYVIISILGHELNQIIKFENGIIKVHHFNDRFSANRPGITYKFEAIGE